LGRLALLALTLYGAAAVASGQASLPFDAAVAEADRPALEECRASPDGVAVTWSLPNSLPEGRVDLLDAQKGFPRWRWRSCAVVRGGSASLSAAPGTRVLAIARASHRDSYLLDGPLVWPGVPTTRRFEASAMRTLGGEGAFPEGQLSGALLSGSDTASRDPLCESDGKSWQCPSMPAAFRGVLALCPAGTEGRFALVEGPGSMALALEPGEGFAMPLRLEMAGGSQTREPALRLVLAVKQGYRPVPGLVARPIGGLAYWIYVKEPPRDTLLEVSAGGMATKRVPLESFRTTPCGEMGVMNLPLAWEIAGHVLDRDGTPLAGSKIVVREPGEAEKALPNAPLPAGGRILQEVIPDDTGAFRISGLEELPYLVRACHPARRCQERLMRPPFEPIEIRFDESGILRGRVLSSAGAPEPGAAVEVTPNLATAKEAEDTVRLVSFPVQTDAEGRFQIAVQGAGQFELVASAAGGAAARREIAVTEIRSPIDLGDIRLSQGGTFRARVPGCAGGELYLVGPMDDDTLPQMKRFTLDSGGQTTVELPGGGEWLTGARCGGQEKYLEPKSLPRVEELWEMGIEIVFEIQEEEDPDAGESDTASR
jgi:hypothetical protein